MPGWQITLIAVGAALLAATLAVLLDPDTSHPPERDHRGRLSHAQRTSGAAGPAMLARRCRCRPTLHNTRHTGIRSMTWLDSWTFTRT